MLSGKNLDKGYFYLQLDSTMTIRNELLHYLYKIAFEL